MTDLTYQASVEPEPLPGRPNPRFPDEVSPQVYGSNIGQGIEQAASVLQGVHDKVQAQARQTMGTDANNKVQATMLDLLKNPDTGAFTKMGQNSFGLAGQYLPQFDQQTKAIVDAVPDPQVRVAVAQMVQQHRNQFLEQLDSHELNQHQEFTKDTSLASIKLAQQNAAEFYNAPKQIASNIDTVDVSLQHLAQQYGWSPEELQEQTHLAHVQLHTGVITNMLTDKKYDMASAYLDANKGELSTQELKLGESAIASGRAGDLGDSIVNQFRNSGPDAGAAAYAQLDQANLSDTDKDKVRERVRQGLSLLNEQRRTQYADQLTALETGIASGSPPPSARAIAFGLYHNYALDQSQYGAALSGIVRAEKQDQADAQALARGTAAFSNRTPLDAKNSDDQNATNLLFGKLTGAAAPGSDAFANAAVSITDHVGVIPKDVVSWARASVTGGNPAQAAAAANVLSRLQETNPRAYAFALDDKTRAMVASINGPVQAGADPQATVNLARTNASLPKAETDLLTKQWENKTTGPMASQATQLASLLKSDPAFKPGWFSGLPAVPPLMQGEFNQLTRNYYLQTGGNVVQARALAANDLKSTWGVSEINGNREIMQYAPESMFPGLTASVIRSDIASTVASHAEAFQNVDAGKVRLTATDRTARTGGQDWTLSVPDQFGAYDVVRGKDGNPLTYRLPVNKVDYAAVKARQTAAAIDSARATQQLRRDAEAGREQAIEQQGAL